MFRSPAPAVDDAGEEECTNCGRAAGVLLAAVGGALLFMGLDLVTGGTLSRFLTGGLFGAGAPGPDPGYDDDDDDDGGEAVGEGDTEDDDTALSEPAVREPAAAGSATAGGSAR
jgi:hypothetical protein